jgi:23S rRNA pseudouridine1911/1915/1917 synthase
VIVPDTRSLPVPDGLDGMRLDQAVSRLFGLSRTVAATLVESGDVTVDGIVRAKADKVSGGSWLEVVLPPPPTAPAVVAERVEGLQVIYSDDEIVVVDKPVGVAAHPSPGWDGPTVIGGLGLHGAHHRHERRRRTARDRAPARRGYDGRDGGREKRTRI